MNIAILQVCDSVFPIGAFTLSNGLETFVQKGIIYNEETLESYMDTVLSLMPYNELGVMALAYKICSGNFKADIITLDNLFNAYKSAREVREGSNKLCKRLIKLCFDISSDNMCYLNEYYKLIKSDECEGSYPIAMGIYAYEKNVPIIESLETYCYSMLSTITTNAVKGVPLSQTVGQRVLYKAIAKIKAIAEKTEQITLDEIGVGGIESDIYAMEHEALYSRLYMS